MSAVIKQPPIDVEEAGRRRKQLEERQLSDHAYTQRRAMLVMAAVTFAISWGGVRLSSIEALGLSITTWDERYLLGFAAVVLAYLIGNFATLAQPAIVAWRADFEWFKLDANRALATATQLVRDGATMARQGLTEGGASGPLADQMNDLLGKIEGAFDKDVPKRAKQYIELHRARLRFEYAVPVSISLAVLYLVIPRLLALHRC